MEYKDTLILSGGGLLGVCTLGALYVLFEEYNQQNFKRIAGTSVGALIGLLLCFKTPSEIYEIFLTRNLFNEENIDFIEYFKTFGFIKHDVIYNELCNHIPANLKFKELYFQTKKELCIVGTNVSLEQCELFDYKRTPEMNVIDAICISLSVPFLFQKYVYNNNVYVDGCVSMNYPWNVFNVKDTQKLGISLNSLCNSTDDDFFKFSQKILNILLNEKQLYNNNTLCINIDFPFMKEYTKEDILYLYTFGQTSAYKWLKKVK